jgi:hypothetical protein
MSSVGFKPTIPPFERAETFNALDRAATVMGCTGCNKKYTVNLYGIDQLLFVFFMIIWEELRSLLFKLKFSATSDCTRVRLHAISSRFTQDNHPSCDPPTGAHRKSLCRTEESFAAVLQQQSFLVSAPSGRTTIILFFPGHLCVLEWGHLLGERRGSYCDYSEPSSAYRKSFYTNSETFKSCVNGVSRSLNVLQ